MRLAYHLKVVACFLSIVPSVSSAAQFQCPSSLEIEEAVRSPISPWEKIVSPHGYQLDRALVFSHHPSEGGSLVPDKTIKGKGVLRDIWYFSGKTSEGFWIGCRYLRSNIVLVQPVGSGVGHCEVSYETLPSGKILKLKSIQCE
jgi:hypothetical protein